MATYINYGKIWNYLSEDTGEIMEVKHPCALVIDDKLGIFAFPFSHDEMFGVEGKEKIYSIEAPPEFSMTRIKTLEELELTKNYN